MLLLAVGGDEATTPHQPLCIATIAKTTFERLFVCPSD